MATRTFPWLGWNLGWGWIDPRLKGPKQAIRWTGKLTAPAAGSYKLRLRAQDDAKLWIDGKEVLAASAGEKSVTSLPDGRRHRGWNTPRTSAWGTSCCTGNPMAAPKS